MERHSGVAGGAPGACRGNHQGVRARRAARGQLPADGDPGRARDPLRRIQHGALGLHQQRRRCDGVGARVPQSQHRCHHDDIRLHADLRGSRAARGEHPRPERALRALAGRHGAQHSGRLPRGGRGRHAQGGRRRRAGATRRGERQMGGPLEDGAHRAPGVGEDRRRQPARALVSSSDLHGRRRRGSDAARAGPAHRARRQGPAQRRVTVRQRLRAGVPGGRAQAGRFLRQRRCALSDGGHGDGRDPPQHPLGVAAQGGAAARGRWRDRGEGGRTVHRRTVRAAPHRGVREAARGGQPRCSRRLQEHDAADHPHDRRRLRPRRHQGAVVHRSAEHQPEQP